MKTCVVLTALSTARLTFEAHSESRGGAILLSLVPAPPSDLPQIDALEKKIIAQKHTIKRGHFVFTTNNKNRCAEIGFDEPTHCIRGDFRRSNAAKIATDPDAPGETKIHTKDLYIHWTFDGKGIGLQPSVSIFDSTHDAAKRPIDSVQHPRIIGMAPMAFPNLVNAENDLHYIVGRKNRTNIVIKKDTVGGINCIQVSFRVLNTGGIYTECHYWVRPDLDYVVQRIETERPGLF